MRKRFITFFAPYAIAFSILNNEEVIAELKDEKGYYAVTWNEGGVYRGVKENTIIIAFIPEVVSWEIPNFFSRVAANPMCFVFLETQKYGQSLQKVKTPNDKPTCAVISRGEFTTERIIETIRFMRSEFP